MSEETDLISIQLAKETLDRLKTYRNNGDHAQYLIDNGE